jgi:cyclophilin family peptidyl-prolyl cis-trans isomerase
MIFKQLSFFILFTLFTQGVFSAEADATDTSLNQSPPVEVIFDTTMGSFTLELYPEKAPKTVDNFLVYVDEGFYTNTLFHRVIPRFMVQGGGFEKGLKKKPTHSPVINESDNGLRNLRGTISMARTRSPHSATSQFFINAQQNISLDYKDNKPGYTVFGKVTEGMKVIDNIIKVPTERSGRHQDVPKEDVVILSVKRKGGKVAQASKQKQERFIAGEHYVVLDRPVPTRDNSKIEVVEMFSYGCPHCYEFDPLVREWSNQQADDVDFWFFPAVWNASMKLYARAFYAARELNVAKEIHLPLFTAIVIKQENIRNKNDLTEIFAKHGVDKKDFTRAFNSTRVETEVKHAEERVRLYKPVGVPEIIVNGKYRVDRMHAGGLTEMLAVVDYLVNKERATLKK